jgi:hypothetical protein
LAPAHAGRQRRGRPPDGRQQAPPLHPAQELALMPTSPHSGPQPRQRRLCPLPPSWPLALRLLRRLLLRQAQARRQLLQPVPAPQQAPQRPVHP